jgi:translocation and assembly module TamB
VSGLRRWAGKLMWGTALMVLGLAMVLTLGTAAGLAMLWRGDGAQAWVLTHLPGVRVTGPQGNVWGAFKATSVEVDLPRGGLARLAHVSWQGLRLHWAPQAAWQLGVSVQALQAGRLDLRWVANPKASPGAPVDVASPVAVQIARLQVGEAHSPWWGEVPLQRFDGSVAVQALGGATTGAKPLAGVQPLPATQARHAVTVRALSWQGWRLTGQLALATDHGLALDADVQGQGAAQWPPASAPSAQLPQAPTLWAQAHASGRLSDMQATLAVSTATPLTGAPPAEAQVMAVRAQAQVQPFASWPVSSLVLTAQAVDLSRLWSAGPSTRLSGEVKMKPEGPQALLAEWRWRNALAGPWNEGRVPVAQTQGLVRWSQAFAKGHILAQPWLQGTLDVRVDGPGASAQGNLRAQGGWGGQQPLVLSWKQLWLPGWDQRAPPLSLSTGELRLEPDWQLGKLAPVPTPAAQGSSVPAGASSPSLAATVPRGRWQLKAQGEVVGLRAPGGPVPPPASGPPVGTARRAVALDGRGAWAFASGAGQAGSLTVDQLSLDAAQAQALLSAIRMSWGPAGLQALSGKLQLQAFDPAVWLPWPAEVIGRNALSGQASVNLNAQAEGEVAFTLQPSQLGGVAVQGHAGWQTPSGGGAGTGAALSRLDVALDVAGNQLALQTQWPRVPGQPAWPHGPQAWAGMRSQWQVAAPALGALRNVLPLLKLRELQGALQLQGQVEGVWPDLSTSGDWRASGLHVQAEQGPVLSLGQAQGRWLWDGRHPASPAALHADVSQAEVLGWQIPRVQAHLEGLLRDHRVSVQAQVVVPGHGKWAGQTLNLDAQGQGAWQGQSGRVQDALQAAQAGWLGQLQQLRVSRAVLAPAAQAAASAATDGSETLMALSPTTVHWARDATGSQWRLSPTALSCLGLALQLDDFMWREAAHPAAGGAGGSQVRASAHLVPVDVVAQLQRWQPDAGWGGKLMLDGQVQLSRDGAGAWRVAADLGRQGGDLTLREPTIEGSQAQALGIRDSRVQLRAEGGVWRLTEHFDGALLGRFDGEQTVRTTSPAAWPGPQDALQGKLLLTAPNLRPWGTWMPAGWRLTGDAQAQAVLGGTLGAPTYEGQIEARHLGLAQALMGVQLREGELSVRLAGDQIKLDRFQALSGDQAHPGKVSATGEARLSTPAQATVRVQADHFAALQRVDRRLIVSGDAQLQLTQDSIGVDGALRVDEGLFDISRSDAPTVGDDVNVLKPEGDANEDTSTVSTGGRKTRVKVDIDLGDHLHIQGRGLEAKLTGKLKATVVGNKPSVLGTVNVVNGRYAAYGQKLVVAHSTVVFTGPADNPRLDILAMRPQVGTATDADVKVGVSITGTAQDPRIRLYADPEMSETEKLSWLVLGRAPSGLGGADIGLLQSAAVALLSGEGKSTSDNLIGALGLDELSVHQSDGTVKETVVNVGKQVSKYWYVGYERNLAATSGSWQLVYRLAQRFMVRMQAGEANALDFIWSWRWD